MTAFIGPLVGAGLSGLAGGFGRSKGKSQSKTDRQKQQVIDQLMQALYGSGPLADLFNFDKDAFQYSFVDPAKQMFSDQIAPQIQQQFIASGMQRGSGLTDTLTRAGVDLDQLLNQQFAQMLQQAQQNKLGAINSILGAQVGQGQQDQGFGSAFLEGLIGGSADFAEPLTNTLTDMFNRKQSRKGFS